jgi:hypothetical protein
MGLHAMEGRTVDIKEPKMTIEDAGLSRFWVQNISGNPLGPGRYKIGWPSANYRMGRIIRLDVKNRDWYLKDIKDMQNEIPTH